MTKVIFVTRSGGGKSGGSYGHQLSKQFYSSIFPAISIFEVSLPKGSSIKRKIKTAWQARKGYVSGCNSESLEQFKRLLMTEHFDLVIIDSSLFGHYAMEAKKLGKLVITQFYNCEFDYISGEAAMRGGLSSLIVKAVYLSERSAIQYSDLCFTLTKYDLARLEKIYGLDSNIEVNNIFLYPLHEKLNNTNFPVSNNEFKVKSILFVGSYSFQNINAVKYILERNYRFPVNIVGNVGSWINKNIHLLLIDNERINIFGQVESLKPFYSENTAIISPMYLGSGLKIKILDGLAEGLPTFTSVEGMIGFEFAVRSGFIQPLKILNQSEGELILKLNPQDLVDSLNCELSKNSEVFLNALSKVGLNSININLDVCI